MKLLGGGRKRERERERENERENERETKRQCDWEKQRERTQYRNNERAREEQSDRNTSHRFFVKDVYNSCTTQITSKTRTMDKHGQSVLYE